MANESSWVERFYTHFLGRDLAYLFAGGLFICVVEYALWAKLCLPQRLSLELFGFLLGSYFLGLALSEFSDLVGLVQKQPKTPEGYSNSLVLHQALVKKYDERVLNRHERTVFLMHVGASVGVSSFWGAVFMFILALYRLICKANFPSTSYVWIFIGLIVYGIYMIVHSRWKTRQIEEQRRTLAAGIEDKQQGGNVAQGTSANMD
ncbi:MAG: hypothetical protein ACREOW_06455 [Thermodesulfobacteriota bacterium]